jgi:mannose-6-phosphate isomerase-like protein (cupin superfamily)
VAGFGGARLRTSRLASPLAPPNAAKGTAADYRLDLPFCAAHDVCPEQTASTMTDSSYLSGKVVRKSLPVLRTTEGAAGLPLKRLLLPQGELAQFYDADEPVRYLAFLELRDGGVRGNHYHESKEEFIYLIQGELQLVAEDIHSRAREIVALQAGDLVVIQPGVAHALRTVKSGQAVEFSRSRFDRADIHRYPLI